MIRATLLEGLFEEFKYSGNTVIDLSFDTMPFLKEKEAVLTDKGERKSKSYYDNRNREIIRIEYENVIGDYKFQNEIYSEIFIGIRKIVKFATPKNTFISKSKKMYEFNLQPIFVGDGSETIVGFSSPKQRRILKQQRIAADDCLQAKNPEIYAFLYSNYNTEYDYYIKTGISTRLIAAIMDEADVEVQECLNRIVHGSDDQTIKDLILDNLQNI